MLYYSKKSNLLIVLTISLVLALALVGCNGGNGNDETEGVTFKIGSAGYAEVEITGELAKAIIEEKTAHTVEHVKNMGLALSHEAVIGGDLDMYTSFTGTLFLGLMEQTLTDEYRDPEKVYQYVSDNYLADYNIYTAPAYGYNNTYAISVPGEWAAENNVTTISDLAPFAADMTLATDTTWQDYPGQGYKEFTELYGFEFKETPQMDFGLMYRSIDSGDTDAICSYSTDGQLVAQNLLVLEDDLGFNPPYNGILVISNDVIEEYPEIKEAVAVVEDLIDTAQMQALNKAVAVDGEEPSTVARRFLQEQGVIE